MVIGLTSWWVGCWSRILKFPVHQNRVGRKVFSGFSEFIWIYGSWPQIHSYTLFSNQNTFQCLGLQGVWSLWHQAHLLQETDVSLEPSPRILPAIALAITTTTLVSDDQYTSPRRLDRLPTNLIEGSLLFVFLRLMYLKMSSPCMSFAKLNYLWILRSLPSTIFQRHLLGFFKNQEPTLPKKVLAKWCGCTG